MKLKRALLAGPLLMISGGWLAAQTPAAQIRIDTNRVIGEVHPHLFGNFAEHLGRSSTAASTKKAARYRTRTGTARTC